MRDPPEDKFFLLKSMAEASPLALAVSEGASHIICYVNPAFCRLFVRPAADFLGRTFAEACPDAESEPVMRLLDRVLESGAAQGLADLSHAVHESPLAYWTYAAWPLLEHEGVATQITDTTENYLETRRRVGELRDANQHLVLAALREDQRSEKLLAADRAKDEFIAMLAHELRNPLAAVRSGIYLLSQRAAGGDTATHETCALLERQMRHLSRLLDDLLDVSRMTRGRIELRLETVDLARTLQQAIASCRSLLELNRHDLRLTVPEAPVRVTADPVRLDQIVTNLLQNAIKYMKPGGTVSVSLEISERAIDPGAPHLPGTAWIRVRDEGIGISPETLPHIFELFVQAEPGVGRSQGGLGIGLTLVKHLVELHGGVIDAYSAGLGSGSEFRVQLPIREQEAAEAADPPAFNVVPAGAKGGINVLLVEDNVAAAVTLGEVLELWGHQVRIAHNGAAALASAAASPPDVVLLDIGLPGMDGYEVADLLRQLPGFGKPRMVALTGYGQARDHRRSLESGFDYHLTKPVELDDLRRIIEG